MQIINKLKFVVYSFTMNIFCLTKINDKKFNLENNKIAHNKYLMFEVRYDSSLVAMIYLFVIIFYRKNYKILLFYYSPFDKYLGNIFFKFFYQFYFKILKNNCDVKIVNLYRKANKNQILKSYKIFKLIKNKKDVNKINYKKYNIGKYIYQSYCRELLKETVDIKNKDLLKFILRAITTVDETENLFKKFNIYKIFISHTMFIRFGLTCNVAKKNRAKIFILHPITYRGYFNRISLLKISNKLLQIERYWLFKEDFKKIKNKRKALKNSKKDLDTRIYGGKISSRFIKGGISPYSNKILNFNSKKTKVIILPSCFFDTANFYRSALFPDSYTWINYLLQKAKKTNYEWYVKSHPDGIKPNNVIIKKLKKKYPFIKILPSNISNLTFKKNRFKAMFTFNGSAIHEFIYMGIPSYAASDNKQSGFTFGKRVKSINEFNNIIKNVDNLKIPKNYLNQILKFNYVFVNQLSRDWLVSNFLNDRIVKKLRALHDKNNILDEYKKLNILYNNINNTQIDNLYKILKKI